ncbi:hypothetical protein [Nitrospina gracilis]|uniref:hypothetical protein n=1 Tax=Nitrospina gracilis TaxID=35801 RepID=UPI001F33C665|nr:hypothetical protein [Nitrospina gracilis]MCF8719323.1 hypothetical protein [Nitrospina gracilis Nb-211]
MPIIPHKVFYWTCPLPLLLFGVFWWYVNQFEGWGQWAAAPMLIMPIAFSFLVSSWGVVLIVQERLREQPVTNLVLGTLLGGSVVLLAIVRWLQMEVTQSF